MVRRIDPYSVRLFVAAAQAGSILRAAEVEHIAPSALGRRLTDLEHAFGTPLLIRSPKGVTLTEAGRIVCERGERMETELQDLLRDVQARSDVLQGTVRLHANMSAVIGFLPERLHRFTELHPHVVVHLHEHDTRDVVRACLDDRADIGAGVAMPLPAGLDAWHFADDPLLVIAPADHELARDGQMSFLRLLEHKLVGVHAGGALDRLLTENALGLGKRFSPFVSVSSFDAVCRMVEAGLGIAVIPQSAAAAYAGSSRFIRVPLNEVWAHRELQLYALRKNPRPRVVEALIETLLG